MKGNILLKFKSNNLAYKLKEKANEYMQANSYKSAVKEYLSAILLDKNDFESYLGLGISYKYLNRTDKAIDALEKALLLNQNDAKVYYELGICYLITGRICQAIQNLRNSIYIDRKNLNAQIQLGLAHEALDEPEMALLIYKTIMENHPSYVRAYEQTAFLLMDMKKYQEAGQILAKLVKIFPECTHAYLGLGVCYENLNNIKRAKRYYNKFISLCSDQEEINTITNKIKNMDLSKIKKSTYLRLL